MEPQTDLLAESRLPVIPSIVIPIIEIYSKTEVKIAYSVSRYRESTGFKNNQIGSAK